MKKTIGTVLATLVILFIAFSYHIFACEPAWTGFVIMGGFAVSLGVISLIAWLLG